MRSLSVNTQKVWHCSTPLFRVKSIRCICPSTKHAASSSKV